MYQPIKIEQLSKQQISRLLNGHSIRVKANQHGRHTLQLHKDQVKKLLRSKTGAVNLQFEPFQISNHQHLRGEGIGKFFKKVGKTLKKIATSKVGKQIQKGLVKTGLDIASSSGYLPPSLKGVVQQGANKLIEAEGIRDMYHKIKPHAKKVAKRALPHISRYLKEEIAHAKPQIYHHTSRALVPYVSDQLAHQIADYGSSQLAEQATRGVTHLTGYGVKKSHKKKTYKKKGGALYPAGY